MLGAVVCACGWLLLTWKMKTSDNLLYDLGVGIVGGCCIACAILAFVLKYFT